MSELGEVRRAQQQSLLRALSAGRLLQGRSGLPAPFAPRRTRGRPQPTILVTPPVGETICVEASSRNGSDKLVWSKHDGPVRAGFDAVTSFPAVKLPVSETAYYDLHIERLILAAEGGATVTVHAGSLSRVVAVPDAAASDTLAPQTVALGLLAAGTPVSVEVSAAVSSARATLQLVDTPRTQVDDPPSQAPAFQLLADYDAQSLGLTDSATVTTWPNAAPGGVNDLDEGGTKPVYLASGINGRPAVQFGSGRTIGRSNTRWESAHRWVVTAIYVVVEVASLSEQQYIIRRWPNTATGQWVHLTANRTGAGVGTVEGNTGFFDASSTWAVGVNQASATWDGTTVCELRSNGTLRGSGDTGDRDMSSLRFSGNAAGDSQFPGKVGQVLIYGTVLNDGQTGVPHDATMRSQVEAYLAGRWGL